MFRWWHRLWCKHTETIDGTETWSDIEYDEIWVEVFCANPKCRKVVEEKVVGYVGDGIVL